MATSKACVSRQRQAAHIFLLVAVLQQSLHQTNAFHQPRRLIIGRPNTHLGIQPLGGNGRDEDVGETTTNGADTNVGEGIYYEDDLQMSSPPHAIEDPTSPRRQSRLQIEATIRKRFAQGEALRTERDDRTNLQENLRWSQAAGDVIRVRDLKAAIKRLEERDPDFVYSSALRSMTKAEAIKDPTVREFAIKQYRTEAEMARKCIDRFNLDGIWVGNYRNGPQLVNVTYSDAHTLVATKVTGDKFINRGEESFTANLAPSEEADPIELSDSAASKWGAKKLQRHPGQGQIALEGGKDKKRIDGQLVMFDDYFSFTWIPMKHTVFFSRPTAQQVIHLMRDVLSKEDEIANMKSHLEHCYNLNDDTTATDQTDMHDIKEEPFRRIHRSDDPIFVAKHDGKKIDAATSKLAFLKLNKIKGYLDDIFLG